MSIAPTIVQQRPPGPLISNESGTTVPRRYSILATSELNALAILKAFGIYRGCVFKDFNGSIPNPQVIAQNIQIIGKPPAVFGGVGQYICDVNYSSQQGVLRAVPGGPAVFTPRPSLSSTPVDLDAQGNPILTSSEEPLDPPLTALRPNEVLHGEFYIQSPSAAAAYAILRPYNASLNASPFFGAPRGGILSHVFSPEPSDTGWVRVEVDFEYRKSKSYGGKTYEGWHDTFPDRGTRIIIDNTQDDPSKRYQNLTVPDSSGNQTKMDQPYPLNGKGQKQSPNSPATCIDANNYLYMEFNSVPGMRLS
jgi:hypothetical protein